MSFIQRYSKQMLLTLAFLAIPLFSMGFTIKNYTSQPVTYTYWWYAPFHPWYNPFSYLHQSTSVGPMTKGAPGKAGPLCSGCVNVALKIQNSLTGREVPQTVNWCGSKKHGKLPAGQSCWQPKNPDGPIF